MQRLRSLALLLLSLNSLLIQADPINPDQIPTELRQWQDWVLYDSPSAKCPARFNDFDQHNCLWRGRLNLVVEDQRLTFSQTLRLLAPGWVALPGSAQHWPAPVKVNATTAAVVDVGGVPSLWLAAGDYRLEGQLQWNSRPEAIQMPVDTGWMDVQWQGKQSGDWHLDAQGKLWLGNASKGADAANKGDTVNLRVFRKLVDDEPMRLETRLELDISGHEREITLGRLQLHGFALLALHSPLPARIEADGSLRIQARAGQWKINAEFRQQQPATDFSIQPMGKLWPAEEIWVFEEHPDLRVVEVNGAATMDPSQTLLPPEWRQLPAYLMRAEQPLHLQVMRRGDAQPAPNQLQNDSELWLDFAGTGITWHDQIRGRMNQGWRLEVRPQVDLGRVSINGEPQLLTQLDGQAGAGVEVRRSALDLQSYSRLPLVAGTLPLKLPAAVWQSSFDNLSATLQLPPGWKALAVIGSDQVDGTWLDRWTLWNIFIVLLIAVAIGRLAGWGWGGLALVALAFAYQEPEAPIYIWLNIAVAVALLRVAPAGLWQKGLGIYRNLSFLVLVIWLCVFAIQQVREAIYPQLEHRWQRVGAEEQGYAGEPQAVMSALPEAASVMDSAASRAAPRKLYKESGAKASPLLQYDRQAQIQTGPGAPQWSWNQVHFGWSGPVAEEQQVRLWILSPGQLSLVRVVQVILLFLLALAVIGSGRNSGSRRGKVRVDQPASTGDESAAPTMSRSPLVAWARQRSAIAPALALLATLLLLGAANAAHAEMPNPELLKELKSRLLAPPSCSPQCAAISQGDLELNADQLRLSLQLGVLADSAVPLPVRSDQWLPSQILLDGQPLQLLQKDADGFLLAHLSAGTHQLLLQASTRNLDKLELSFPMAMHNLQLQVSDWQTSGWVDGKLVGQSLKFERQARQQNPAEPQQTLFQEPAPAFVELRRTLVLGLNWEVQNRLLRVAPERGVISLDVPLLAGESITSSGPRAQDGVVKAVLAADQNVLTWTSRLTPVDLIQLTAAKDQPWRETWTVELGPTWNLHFEGLAPLKFESAPERWTPTWKPQPGESLQLHLSRPKAVAGATLSIDRVQLDYTPGQRGANTQLDLQLRSSLGNRFVLDLPEGASLQRLSLDGAEQPLSQNQRRIDLGLHPGAQQLQAQWLDTTALTDRMATPALQLPQPATNINIALHVPADRWVLWVAGPALGPAVLYWGMLLVLIALSLALGWHRGNPLRSWQWLLLALGMSLASIQSSLLVVLWFYALQKRRQAGANWPEWQFNLVQIGLVLLTLMAIGGLIANIPQGLLGSPDMQVVGNGSSAHELFWYQDRSEGGLPQGSLISLSLFWYRLVMLLWSLWLAFSLISWLRWAWQCFSSDGYWRQEPAKPKSPLTAAAPSTDAAHTVEKPAGENDSLN